MIETLSFGPFHCLTPNAQLLELCQLSSRNWSKRNEKTSSNKLWTRNRWEWDSQLPAQLVQHKSVSYQFKDNCSMFWWSLSMKEVKEEKGWIFQYLHRTQLLTGYHFCKTNITYIPLSFALEFFHQIFVQWNWVDVCLQQFLKGKTFTFSLLEKLTWFPHDYIPFLEI